VETIDTGKSWFRRNGPESDSYVQWSEEQDVKADTAQITMIMTFKEHE
jgi:hypothetical protein